VVDSKLIAGASGNWGRNEQTVLGVCNTAAPTFVAGTSPKPTPFPTPLATPLSPTSITPPDPAYVAVPLATCSHGQSLYQLDIVDDVDYNDLGWDVVNTCNATIVEQRVTGYFSCCQRSMVTEQFCLEDNQRFTFTMVDYEWNCQEVEEYYALYKITVEGTIVADLVAGASGNWGWSDQTVFGACNTPAPSDKNPCRPSKYTGYHRIQQ
jgi:hypothetical protein